MRDGVLSEEGRVSSADIEFSILISTYRVLRRNRNIKSGVSSAETLVD